MKTGGIFSSVGNIELSSKREDNLVLYPRYVPIGTATELTYAVPNY